MVDKFDRRISLRLLQLFDNRSRYNDSRHRTHHALLTAPGPLQYCLPASSEPGYSRPLDNCGEGAGAACLGGSLRNNAADPVGAPRTRLRQEHSTRVINLDHSLRDWVGWPRSNGADCSTEGAPGPSHLGTGDGNSQSSRQIIPLLDPPVPISLSLRPFVPSFKSGLFPSKLTAYMVENGSGGLPQSLQPDVPQIPDQQHPLRRRSPRPLPNPLWKFCQELNLWITCQATQNKMSNFSKIVGIYIAESVILVSAVKKGPPEMVGLSHFQQTDSQQTDFQQTDFKQTDFKQTDSQQTDFKQTGGAEPCPH